MKSPFLFATAIALLAAAPVRADFVTLWELGTDNESQADFSQESGVNAPPGVVSHPDEVEAGRENELAYILPSKDDDYYFAGDYVDTVGLVEVDEPWKAFERAVVDGDGINRIHFILTESQVAPSNQLRFTIDLFGLGASAGASTHNIQVSLNGVEIFSRVDIAAATLLEITVSAGAASAVAGENVLEINRFGGTSSSWIQFDYLRAEVNTDVCPEPICSFSASSERLLPGQEVTLSWIASPDATLVLNPGAVNLAPHSNNGIGFIKLTPSGTTTYVLTATKGAETETAEALVTVPVILGFGSNRAALSFNETATLFWATDPRAVLSLDQGIGNLDDETDELGQGSVDVAPGNQEKTYTLTATRGTETETASFTIGYAEYATIWQLGLDDESQAEFVQEAGNNQPPGSPASLDNDFYFPGVYADTVGTVYVGENPATNFGRAVTTGSPANRVHFFLNPPGPPSASRFRLLVDLCLGGWWDNAAGVGGAGFGTHDVAISINGFEVWSQTDITGNTLAEIEIAAGEANIGQGENIIEIARTGGFNGVEGNGAWIQFDYIRTEINTNTSIPPAQAPVITAVTRNATTGAITLTWTSQPGQTFAVRTSENLGGWPVTLAGAHPAEAGATTSYTHQPAAGTGTLYYKIFRN